MPMPPLDPADGATNNILDRLIYLLSQNADFTACIDGGIIHDYDTRGATPQGRPAPSVLPVACLVPMEFDLQARTKGGRGIGEHTNEACYVLLLYRAGGQAAGTSTSATNRAIHKAAWFGAMAILTCRPDPSDPTATPPYVSQWADLTFRSPACVFEAPENQYRARLGFDIGQKKVPNP